MTKDRPMITSTPTPTLPASFLVPTFGNPYPEISDPSRLQRIEVFPLGLSESGFAPENFHSLKHPSCFSIELLLAGTLYRRFLVRFS